MKRLISIVLVVVMLMAIPATAFAAPSRVASATPSLSFSGTTANCKVTIRDSGKAISATMSLWDGSTCIDSWSSNGTSLVIISGSHDVEYGIFGQKADSAVREFQSKRKITDDGDCGTNTWGEVATCLSSSTSGNVTTFITNYLCPSGYGSNVMKATLNSAGTYHTYSTYDQYGIAINSIFTRPV